MASPKCALCDVEITKVNDTKEHIIPNSIGGRKKVNGFICKTCNNKSGVEWDSVLAKQLNPFSLFFGINRQRGSVPPQIFKTAGGEKLQYNADGSLGIEKPTYSVTPLESGSGVLIQIRARNTSEAKHFLKDVKRNYPQVDMDEMIRKLEPVSSYCDDGLIFNFQHGGPETGRSIVKSALALAVKSGIPAETCTEAINYLRNKDSEACFGYFYETDLIKNRPEGIPLHCVSIKGCRKTQQVIGYVEYFGVQRMVLCLSKSYKGVDISDTYAINPATGEELDLIVELNLSSHEIQEAYDYKKVTDETFLEPFDKVLPPRTAEKFENEKKRVIQEAAKYASENCRTKEGEMREPEYLKKLANLTGEKLRPFIRHMLTQNRNNK